MFVKWGSGLYCSFYIWYERNYLRRHQIYSTFVSPDCSAFSPSVSQTDCALSTYCSVQTSRFGCSCFSREIPFYSSKNGFLTASMFFSFLNPKNSVNNLFVFLTVFYYFFVSFSFSFSWTFFFSFSSDSHFSFSVASPEFISGMAGSSAFSSFFFVLVFFGVFYSAYFDGFF